ncbi:hypothetical protein MPER_05687, partial [Moniliophthora perniciosa FA553]
FPSKGTSPYAHILEKSDDSLASLKDGSRGFDILANVIWEELGRSIMDELGSVVFAAGRPNEFKQHYEITQAFIRSIEFLAPSLHSIENMRRHPIYTAFEKRWQLPVYFQLRWKEIVGKVEESFTSGQIKYNDKSAASSPFKTVQASELWVAITACWSAEVFIPEYKSWLQATVLSDSTSRTSIAANDKTLAGSRSGTPVSSDIRTVGVKLLCFFGPRKFQ